LRQYPLSRDPVLVFPGGGLGQSIVLQLVEQHDASISVEDGLHGTGVSFLVRSSKTMM
jgi:signal transduction histidine kinase